MIYTVILGIVLFVFDFSFSDDMMKFQTAKRKIEEAQNITAGHTYVLD